MKYLLHIDTSSDKGLVAITGNGAVLTVSYNEESRNHAGAINLMIDRCAADAAITLQQLSGVVVCAGPGSYTGLRIGMATAKGLCYALDLPLIADNKLEMLARNAHAQYGSTYTQYVALLVARDKEYFIGIYDNNMACKLPPQHIMEEQLNTVLTKNERTYIITNSTVITDLQMEHYVVNRDIETAINTWSQHAFEKYICNEFANLSATEPFYLKQVYTHK